MNKSKRINKMYHGGNSLDKLRHTRAVAFSGVSCILSAVVLKD